MKFWMFCLALAAVLGLPSLSRAEEMTFEGPWKTTNRKLDGIMTGVVTSQGEERWQGKFYGVWQGVKFDYTVDLSGPLDDLRGTATIDGANYVWRGVIDRGEAVEAVSATTAPPRRFRANFTGDRYVGSFEMKEKPVRAAGP